VNARAAKIGWHALVLATVLVVATFAPVWQSELAAVIAIILSRAGPPSWRCPLGLGKPAHPLVTLLSGILGGVALFFFIKLFLQHLCEIITQSQRDLSAFDFARGHLRAEIPLIARIALMAGFCEEVVFRGTIIPRLEAIFLKNKATELLILLTSAAFFGAAHTYQARAGVLLTGLMGFVLGYIYLVCRRRLWPVILIHATYDLLSLGAISSNLDLVLQAWSRTLFSWLTPHW
jgi:membrane protease YdiL (CAAX protease family)